MFNFNVWPSLGVAFLRVERIKEPNLPTVDCEYVVELPAIGNDFTHTVWLDNVTLVGEVPAVCEFEEAADKKINCQKCGV